MSELAVPLLILISVKLCHSHYATDMAANYPKSPKEFCSYFDYPRKTIWYKQKVLQNSGSRWSKSHLVSYRVTSEVLSSGVNPLLRPHFATAKQLVNERLHAGLTEVFEWGKMRSSDLIDAAGTFAPLYTALQLALRPRRPGLDVNVHLALRRSERERRPVFRAGFTPANQPASSSSSSAQQESSVDEEADAGSDEGEEDDHAAFEEGEDSDDAASNEGEEDPSHATCTQSDPSTASEQHSNWSKAPQGTPSAPSSSTESPPHKRGRYNSPRSSSAPTDAADNVAAIHLSSGLLSVPDGQPASGAHVPPSSPPPAASAPSHEHQGQLPASSRPSDASSPLIPPWTAPITQSHGPQSLSGSTYTDTSNISDLSALVDVAKPEPVTIQLATAFLSCVLGHTDRSTSVPIDFSPEPLPFHIQFGETDVFCISDGYLGFTGNRDRMWCDITGLIAASIEAKPKPPEYTGHNEADRIVSVKVLGQQSCELLGMLMERLRYYGIVNDKGKGTPGAEAKIADLSEHHRS
jgi:hypothetical protein